MPTPVFLDANIPMYAAGRDHPLKAPCIQVLRLAASNPAAVVSDSETLQELLHRYLAIGRWTPGRSVLLAFARLMEGRIEPVSAGDMRLAADLADSVAGADARDLVHAAVMRRLSVTRIVSADRGFDRLPGVERLDPAAVDAWGAALSN
jgi:hypothetical protein